MILFGDTAPVVVSPFLATFLPPTSSQGLSGGLPSAIGVCRALPDFHGWSQGYMLESHIPELVRLLPWRDIPQTLCHTVSQPCLYQLPLCCFLSPQGYIFPPALVALPQGRWRRLYLAKCLSGVCLRSFGLSQAYFSHNLLLMHIPPS